jgi:SAM-dependent methyltransferase
MTLPPHSSNAFNSSTPSPWVGRFSSLIPVGGTVLDLACGGGRHSRFLAGLGYAVEAVDRDTSRLGELASLRGVHVREADLEVADWPYGEGQFAGIVVTNYLYRPRLPALWAALADPGVLIYETFMIGNERYGKPSNPDFLLQSQEMLGWARLNGLSVVAFEEGDVDFPKPARVQRLCAVRGQLPGRMGLPANDPAGQRGDAVGR